MANALNLWHHINAYDALNRSGAEKSALIAEFSALPRTEQDAAVRSTDWDVVDAIADKMEGK